MIRQRMFQIVFVALALSQFACASKPSPVVEGYQAKESLMLKEAQTWLKDNKVVGLSFAIVDSEGWQFIGNLGHHDQEKTLPVTDASQFWIGSNTKILTALAVMQLVEEGKLELDQSVTYYLPELQTNPSLQQIKLRHLLSHQSGLIRDYHSASESNAPMSWLVSELANDPSPLKFSSGSFTAYSNLGFSLLGVILERIEQKPFAQVVQTRLFKPLGMDQSLTLDNQQATPSALVTGYVNDQAQSNEMRNSGVADGSVISSSQDMSKLSQAMLQLNQGKDGLVQHASWHNMQQVNAMGELHQYAIVHHGLGWIRAEHAELGDITMHGGSVNGFNSSWIIAKDHQTAVVVLSNSIADTDDLAWQLLSIASLGRTSQLELNHTVSVNSAEWQAGDYGFQPPILIDDKRPNPNVRIDNTKLSLRANEFGRYRLTTSFWPHITLLDNLLPLKVNEQDYLALSDGEKTFILAEKLDAPADWEHVLGEYQLLVNHNWRSLPSSQDTHRIPERIAIIKQDGHYFFASRDSKFFMDGQKVDELFIFPTNASQARFFLDESGPLVSQDWLLAEQQGAITRLRLGNLLYQRIE